MNHLKKFFSFDYQFQIHTLLTRSDWGFLFIGAVAIVLAIVLKFAELGAPNPIDKQYRHKFFDLLLTVGLWELIWFGCRYEDVRFFGSHFVALLGLLVGVIWFIAVAIKMLRHYKGQKQAWDKEQVRLKYLPR